MWRFEGTGQSADGAVSSGSAMLFNVLSGLGWYIFLVEFFP